MKKIDLKYLHVILALFAGLQGFGQDSRLGKPDMIWDMPPELGEISALTFAPGETHLLCLQDERGVVYGLNPQSGVLAAQWIVTGKGDFEGIEMVDSTLYLLRSDGMLFRTTWQDGPHGEVVQMDPGFPTGIDVEGLGYDPIQGTLLLGIKDFQESTVVHASTIKGWVHWDLKKPAPDEQICGLSRTALREGILQHMDKGNKGHLLEWLDQRDDQYPLGPSGLAFHPVTHEIWMISARGKLLLVFDASGNYQRIYVLNSSILPQPEGIAFNQRGDLFISSEGKKGVPGRIAVYKNVK